MLLSGLATGLQKNWLIRTLKDPENTAHGGSAGGEEEGFTVARSLLLAGRVVTKPPTSQEKPVRNR